MRDILRHLDWSVLTDLLYSVVPALICIILHEMAHGVCALWLGDRTAKERGRLSLNPLRHIDPVGLLMMVVFRFGWAKPVPIDSRRFKNPKGGMALTALAGPVCNLLIAAVFLLLYGFLYPTQAPTALQGILLRLVLTTAYLSTSLALFNLIPLPPLDGSKILFAFLPDKAYRKLMRVEKYGIIVLLLISVTGRLSKPLYTTVQFVFEKGMLLAQWAFNLTH